GLADPVEQAQRLGVGLAEEPQLDDGLRGVVGARGDDEEVEGAVLARSRADLEVVRRHVLDAPDLLLGGRLPDQALARLEVGRTCGRTVEREARASGPAARIHGV